MNAYDSTYVSGAQRRLGSMLEFAVYAYGCELDAFYQNFLASSVSQCFEAGDPSVVAGRSGQELALCVLEGGNGPDSLAAYQAWESPMQATREYWTGWALAFYQWASGSSFSAIERRISVLDVRAMYSPYHEMDIRHFCDALDEIIAGQKAPSNLQAARMAAGLSQSQLAKASGVPVRTLQQYEQGQKNINHARADYVIALARVLCCDCNSLLEHRAGPTYEYAVVGLE